MNHDHDEPIERHVPCVDCGELFELDGDWDIWGSGTWIWNERELCGACEELAAMRAELASLELEAQGDGYTPTEREAMGREIASLKRELAEIVQ